jgi:hypothetical protein
MRINGWNTETGRRRWMVVGAAVLAVLGAGSGAAGAERVVLGEYFTMIG